MFEPQIIQGGMGFAISNWTLAQEVSRRGQLGVVSGVAIGGLLTSRLADGDVGGHVRRALAAFPDQSAVGWIVDRSMTSLCHWIEFWGLSTQWFSSG